MCIHTTPRKRPGPARDRHGPATACSHRFVAVQSCPSARTHISCANHVLPFVAIICMGHVCQIGRHVFPPVKLISLHPSLSSHCTVRELDVNCTWLGKCRCSQRNACGGSQIRSQVGYTSQVTRQVQVPLLWALTTPHLCLSSVAHI